MKNNPKTIKRSTLQRIIREIVKEVIKEAITPLAGMDEENKNLSFEKGIELDRSSPLASEKKAIEVIDRLTDAEKMDFIHSYVEGNWDRVYELFGEFNASQYIIVRTINRIIEVLTHGMKEQSTSAAASPVTGPVVFKRKTPMEELDSPRKKMTPEEEYVEMMDDGTRVSWVENKVFWDDVQDRTIKIRKQYPGLSYRKIFNMVALKKAKENLEWLQKNKDPNIVDEMTTTSGGGGSSAGTPGYMVPGAFANKLRNDGHIEVLGYKLTPAGKKEMNRTGDKLLEGKKKK
jgi:hypothetical protein